MPQYLRSCFVISSFSNIPGTLKKKNQGFSLPLLRAEMKPHLSTRSWGHGGHPDLKTVIAVLLLEHLEELASGLRGGAGSQLQGRVGEESSQRR